LEQKQEYSMPDYVYLLENRLSTDQQNALRALREVAREAELILFLTGDAVRDLTSGHAVRDLEVTVQGNALKLKKKIEKSGAKIWGEDEATRTLYLCFPGTVRVDLVSTHRVEYPRLGHPIYSAANIQDDLRRRDFTVNAMAISLNEGSFGLLMDPLNGAADIEARTLRLVSNYGFLEDPSLLIRATRFKVRLGWELEPRTQQRYENAKADGAIEYLSKLARSRELEQIGHEDDGLKVLEAFEAEGWMKVLFPQWTHAKADAAKLHTLHDLRVELLMQGVHADTSAAQMQLLTVKLQPKDLSALKKALLRPGFVEEWNALDASAAAFAKVLLSKDNQKPSATYKLFTAYDPEAILWLGFTSKDKAVQERFNQFLKVWPETRKQIPFALLQEMRIRPELPGYNDLLQALFLELIDGKLQTPEEIKAYLEPHSPPPPPPPVTIKRARGRKAAEARSRDFDEEEEEISQPSSDEDMDDMGGEDDIGLGLPKLDLVSENEEESEEEEEEEEPEEEEAPRAKRVKSAPSAKSAPAARPAKAEAAATPAPPKPAPAKAPAAAPAPSPAPKKAEAPAAAPARAAKPKPAPVPAKAPAKAQKAPAKRPAPAAKKAAAKPAHKPPAKAPAKKAAAKPAHKPAPKKHPVKKAAAHVTSAKPRKVAPPAKAKPKLKPKPHKSAKPAKKPAKKH
jgi:tRNA nucleotidyltransferase (CCA-adding enzyme)